MKSDFTFEKAPCRICHADVEVVAGGVEAHLFDVLCPECQKDVDREFEQWLTETGF